MNIYTCMADELIDAGTNPELIRLMTKEQLDKLHGQSQQFGRNVFAELFMAQELGVLPVITELQREINTIISFDDIGSYR